jgi:hypothetical protein
MREGKRQASTHTSGVAHALLLRDPKACPSEGCSGSHRRYTCTLLKEVSGGLGIHVCPSHSPGQYAYFLNIDVPQQTAVMHSVAAWIPCESLCRSSPQTRPATHPTTTLRFGYERFFNHDTACPTETGTPQLQHRRIAPQGPSNPCICSAVPLKPLFLATCSAAPLKPLFLATCSAAPLRTS